MMMFLSPVYTGIYTEIYPVYTEYSEVTHDDGDLVDEIEKQ